MQFPRNSFRIGAAARRFRGFRALSAVLFLSAVLCGRGNGEEESLEWWTWANVDLHRTEQTRFHLYLDQRLAEGRESYVQVVSPRFKWRMHSHLDFHLDLGLGFTVLSIERGDSGSYHPQARPELELNPSFSIGEHGKIHLRNRIESRWNDFGGSPRIRTRHRFKIGWSDLDLGPVSAFYMNNEWFIDCEKGEWVEDRLIPAAVTFDLSENTKLDLFYMIRFVDRGAGWERDHILGTFLRWSL